MSVWVMGDGSVGQWILGVMRFQKIFGLYSVERHKVEKGAGQVMGEWSVVSGSVDSGCQKLSENIWFVWSKTSHSGDKWRCHRCGTGRDKQQVKIELLSF